ncbi:MAG: SDR family oxidoreductase [Bacillota bacterium]
MGAHYAASKGAVITLTKSFAKAGAAYNVRANCVSPGFIDTDMTKGFGYDPKSVPLGYIGKAEEVAEAIYFLASSRASYITGANLEVNGGYHMG